MAIQSIQLQQAYPSYGRQNNPVNLSAQKEDPGSFFTNLKTDIDKLELTSKKNQQALLYALSPLPPARRISSLPDSLEENNLPRAGLLLGMAAANFPGDVREMGLAFREGGNIFKNGLSAIEYKGQHASEFFKGTFLQGLAKKYDWIRNIDKSLYHTKFGEVVRSGLNVAENIEAGNAVKGVGTKLLKTYEFSGNYFSKLAGRALLRIPVIGLIASSILEIPALIKSTQKEGTFLDKTKSFANQLCKSAGYVGIVNAGIALAGAALMPYGYIAALIGMGIGGSIGLMASKKLNKEIDKII